MTCEHNFWYDHFLSSLNLTGWSSIDLVWEKLFDNHYRVKCPKISLRSVSLKKPPKFGDATTGFPAKWRLRNERKNSILMMHHNPDLDSASDWLCLMGNLIQPIRSTTQVRVVSHHQYGISALVSQTSFGGETSGSVAKFRLFSQAKVMYILLF